ncbi:hypothetical protein [uncultured Campylobacter sp.]|nr:hypothetical protein [uncultured Campylobacter sp.]
MGAQQRMYQLGWQAIEFKSRAVIKFKSSLRIAKFKDEISYRTASC